MKFHIPNMTCGGCVRGVTASIQDVDPNAQVNADLEHKTIEVTSHLDASRIKKALDADDFPATQI